MPPKGGSLGLTKGGGLGEWGSLIGVAHLVGGPVLGEGEDEAH